MLSSQVPAVDFRREFVFLYHDFHNAFLVGGVHYPALRFYVGREIFHEGLAMFLCRLASREMPSGLIRS